MSNQGTRRTVPVCASCKSENVIADAAARWNVEKQVWDVTAIFDKGNSCEDCGAADIEFTWVDQELEETQS